MSQKPQIQKCEKFQATLNSLTVLLGKAQLKFQTLCIIRNMVNNPNGEKKEADSDFLMREKAKIEILRMRGI